MAEPCYAEIRRSAMKRDIRNMICLLICALFISTLLPIDVNADMGPKASVRVSFENMGEELCYGTLLSKKPSTGPNSAWDGDENNILNELIDLDIWRAFVGYEDEDGYYFLQIGWQVNEKKELAWTYYPPDSFKILLYYPETDRYAVSGICERYAFDTYYTVDMAGEDIGSVEYDGDRSSNDRLNAYRSYQYKKEIAALVARILITIAVEMAVALFFGFRGRRALLLLVAVNTVTQIVLNVLLNIIDLRSGPSAFVIGYIALELAVFAIEAVLYTVLMNKLADRARSARYYTVYALVANAISFGVGLVVANILPGIF